MKSVPQSAGVIVFGVTDLQAGCKVGVDQRVNLVEVQVLVKKGYLISSAFTLWQGEEEERKGCFFVAEQVLGEGLGEDRKNAKVPIGVEGERDAFVFRYGSGLPSCPFASFSAKRLPTSPRQD